MDQQAVHILLESCGNDFFGCMQNHLYTAIPVIIKNILIVKDIDLALLSAKFDESIAHVEQSMRKEIDKDTLGADE